MAWAPDYVDAAALKAYLRITDDVDDDQVALAITAASRAVDLHTHRQFGVTASEERVYTASYDRRRCRWLVAIDDTFDSTITVTTDAGTIDEYRLWPANAAQMGLPWTQLVVEPESATLPTGAEDEVTIEAAWGWTTVPTAIEQATLLQASRLISRRDSPYGVAGSPDQGSEVRLLARVDPDVAVTLSPYVRWWAAA